MNRSHIGGPLTVDALAALGRVSADVDRMRHFRTLDRAQQSAAIRRLAAAGQSEHTIAAATGLAVEQIRRLLEADVS
ncbi:MAG: hypothetical protein WBE91_17935 [Steroidobacteraceae bacterium]